MTTETTDPRVSTERYFWPIPVTTAEIGADGQWTAWCTTCKQRHSVSPAIGVHTTPCGRGDYLLAPPGSQHYPYFDGCRQCEGDARWTNCGAVDLTPGPDGRTVVASYRCESGHEWQRDGWADPPNGRFPRTRSLRSALYRHFDAADVLLYVGISIDPTSRSKQHAAAADWTEFAARVEGIWYATRAEAEAAELAAIRTELPVFNRKHAVGDQRAREAAYLAQHATTERIPA